MRFQYQVRGGRCRRFESDGKEDDFAIRMGCRDIQRLERRIHHPHIRALRTSFEQAAATRCGNPDHIAVAHQRDVRSRGQLDGRVQARHRKNANGASGAVHQAHVLWQQILDAVAKDGMGVAAAELHEMVFSGGIDFGANQLRERRRGAAVTEAVDVAHAVSSQVSRHFRE
jgi:hypothetical protein